MTSPDRKSFVLESIADDPEVGRWLAAMEDARDDTVRELAGVTPEILDWRPDAPLNTIGAILYHIALIETSWLLDDIFEGEPSPEWLKSLLPFEDRDGTGRLIQVDGVSMATHLKRLRAVRRYLLERCGRCQTATSTAPTSTPPTPSRCRTRGNTWFASWDLAFHAVTLAHIDPAFAKYQLTMTTNRVSSPGSREAVPVPGSASAMCIRSLPGPRTTCFAASVQRPSRSRSHRLALEPWGEDRPPRPLAAYQWGWARSFKSAQRPARALPPP